MCIRFSLRRGFGGLPTHLPAATNRHPAAAATRPKERSVVEGELVGGVRQQVEDKRSGYGEVDFLAIGLEAINAERRSHSRLDVETFNLLPTLW